MKAKGLHLESIESNYNVIGRTFLVTIGIDEYSDSEIPNLKNAVKDAKDFSNLLLTSFQFKPEYHYTLFNKEANKDNIYKLFDQLIDLHLPNDDLVIYFSGHGYFFDKTNSGYWIPYDANSGKRYTYISNHDLLAHLKAIKVRHLLIFSDSCFSGSIFSTRSLIDNKVINFPSRYAITSGRTELVSDGIPGENSPFANALITLLSKSNDEHIRVTKLARYIEEVTANNSEQLPRGDRLVGFGQGDMGGEFVFIRKIKIEKKELLVHVDHQLEKEKLELELSTEASNIDSYSATKPTPHQAHLKLLKHIKTQDLLVDYFFSSEQKKIIILSKDETLTIINAISGDIITTYPKPEHVYEDKLGIFSKGRFHYVKQSNNNTTCALYSVDYFSNRKYKEQKIEGEKFSSGYYNVGSGSELILGFNSSDEVEYGIVHSPYTRNHDYHTFLFKKRKLAGIAWSNTFKPKNVGYEGYSQIYRNPPFKLINNSKFLYFRHNISSGLNELFSFPGDVKIQKLALEYPIQYSTSPDRIIGSKKGYDENNFPIWDISEYDVYTRNKTLEYPNVLKYLIEGNNKFSFYFSLRKQLSIPLISDGILSYVDEKSFELTSRDDSGSIYIFSPKHITISNTGKWVVIKYSLYDWSARLIFVYKNTGELFFVSKETASTNRYNETGQIIFSECDNYFLVGSDNDLFLYKID